MDKPVYVADKFDWDRDISIEELLQNVIAIKEFPNQLAKVLSTLKEEDLNKTYREGSWTIREIIHHLADSHIVAFIRTKHVVSQDATEIHPYNENKWAEQIDYSFHHEASFMILLGIHQRWSLFLLECLKNPTEHLAKSVYHTGNQRHLSLSQLIALYAWHGPHHLNQITFALNNN
jgi:hypothetical protein